MAANHLMDLSLVELVHAIQTRRATPTDAVVACFGACRSPPPPPQAAPLGSFAPCPFPGH
jgi:hypothetical protein